jgi:ligand-binding SRPBCC domain-containing protein
MGHTQERIIAGRQSGLIEMDEVVTWRAKHFGFHLTHKARITAFDRPHHFRDEMEEGQFQSFVHDHFFEAAGDRTRMREVLVFRSPLGPLGATVDALLLKRYLRRLLESRNRVIRDEAESVGWSTPPSESFPEELPPTAIAKDKHG